MAEKIYIRNASGELEPLTEERFETEELIQKLIGEHPELLGGDQMRPDDPRRWLLIRREMPIEGWAVDHLLLDQDARPTLVEVKRGSNRQIRREIVGQMLDYAATAATVWSERDLRRVFEESQNAPEEVISDLLEDDDQDIDEFWERVAANLQANRLRLLFVADAIPIELERVVKFLNEQTRDNLEVLAVEVKQYPGRFGDALVSRVIGHVDNSHETRTSRPSLDEFLSMFRDDARDAIEAMMASVNQVAGNPRDTFRLRRVSVSIRGRCSLWSRPIYLGRLHVPVSGSHSGYFTFHANMTPNYPEQLKDLLDRWSQQFDDAFGIRHEYKGEIGRAGSMDDLVAHIDLINDRLAATLAELSRL